MRPTLRPDKPSMFRALDAARTQRQETVTPANMSLGRAVANCVADGGFTGIGLGSAAAVVNDTLLPAFHLVMQGVNLDGTALVHVGLRAGLVGLCALGAALALRASRKTAQAITATGSTARHILTTASGCAIVAGFSAVQAFTGSPLIGGSIAALATLGAVASGVLAARR